VTVVDTGLGRMRALDRSETIAIAAAVLVTRGDRSI
jgi:hypothetical protein